MSFLSLYRKYRPENFNDLIGQDHVVQTLKNALKNDRVAHAYLFAGPRGTGKTSTAKVFARALNCSSPGDDFEPCGECSSCQRIDNGSSLDVIEIDAASNRGIDEIRELREKVKFYPGEGDYKVYIIDEVHMLTKGAFNALLKTLEEPPDSVVFILATTEPHKVITTIMSRCQRFDFSLLSLGDIKSRLQYITSQEGYQIEKEALDILARSARGGMRDGISLLDQAISFSDGTLSVQEISKMLGRANKDKLKELLIHLNNKESQKSLELLDKELESGLGIERFSDELISYCRELLLIKECGTKSGILEYSSNYLDELAETAAKMSTVQITDVIDEFASLKQKLRSSARARLQLEISIIKLSSKVEGSSIEDRLRELEYKLDNFLNSSSAADSSTSFDFKDQKSSEDINTQAETEEKDISKPAKRTTGAEKDEKIPEAKISQRKEPPEKDERKKSRQNSQSYSGDLSLEKVKKYWGKVLNQIRKIDVSVQALLREGAPAAVEGKTIVVAFDSDKKFHYKGAVSNKSLITKVVRKILNEAVELEFVHGEYKKKSLNKNSKQAQTADSNNKEKNKSAGHSSEKDNAVSTFSSNNNNNYAQDNKQLVNNNFQNKNAEKQSKEKSLSIEEIARMFSGKIIEVDESILEKRGGN
jgi:DNA polymerase-3 subunit gamma/tau